MTTTSVIAATHLSQPFASLSSSERRRRRAGHDGVYAVDRGDPKGGSCGGRALAGGEADEVAAHRSDWHRDSQPGDRARDEVADHDRLACA